MSTSKPDPFAGWDKEGRPAVMPDGPERFEIVKRGRHYVIPTTGYVVPSVTNILGAIAKPALIHWSANEERKACLDAAAELHADLHENGFYDEKAPKATSAARLTPELYKSILRDRLGHTKQHLKLLNKAANIGSQAHNYAEQWARWKLGQKYEKPDADAMHEAAQVAVMAWEDWKKSVNLEPIAAEKTVWSQSVLAAGTTDLVCEMDVELGDQTHRVKAVVDYKTSKALYWPEPWLQISAYSQMLVEMGEVGDAETWGVIVRLPKNMEDPEFETRLVTPHKRRLLWKAFQAVKATWELMKNESK